MQVGDKVRVLAPKKHAGREGVVFLVLAQKRPFRVQIVGRDGSSEYVDCSAETVEVVG